MRVCMRACSYRQELEHGQGQILELFQRVTSIQAKAEESENIVQDICRSEGGGCGQEAFWERKQQVPHALQYSALRLFL